MSDLELIKKYYGEDMSHFCRDNFSSILETKGLLFNIIESHFAHNKFLYDDIAGENKENSFKNYIYSFVEAKETIETLKTPHELLNEAGYLLYECKTEEEIQAFKKYYHEGEELCTFKGGRLNKNYVFFAVKKDVNEIRREDYKNPLRQDKYGTSVISIQFSKGSVNTLSIKNRYNSKVDNPDATFSNDLENIIAGLTKSFEDHYGFKINSNKQKFELCKYVLANDGKYYRYNYEFNNIYYCHDNIIIDNFEVKDLYKEKERYIVFDYFILDMKYKKIYLYDNYLKDSFDGRFFDILKITIEKTSEGKIIHIITSDGEAKITLSKDNRMIEYYDDIDYPIEDDFLRENDYTIKIEIKNARYVGNDFIKGNEILGKLDLPNVINIGNDFLAHNTYLKTLNMPKAEFVGDAFLFWNTGLETFDAPQLTYIGNEFLTCNLGIKKLNLPKVIEIKNKFLTENIDLDEIYLPNVENIWDCFLFANENLETFDAPKLKSIGYGAFRNNKILSKINIPNIQNIGKNFASSNGALFELDLPNVEFIKENFLRNNTTLCKLNIPKLKAIGEHCLEKNRYITQKKLLKAGISIFR